MNKVSAGIVLYNPNITRLKLVIDAIYPQVDEVLLFNNGSHNDKDIENILDAYTNVILLNSSDNKGIAYALNRMCEYTADKGYDWILTLDQDTICPENLIEKMKPHTDKEDIGIICPGVFYEGRENKTSLNTGVEYIKACMTSASLTRLSTWEKVKGFREDYFIDYVDNEYCMKVRIAGMKILRVNNVQIIHQLGEINSKKFVTYHKPFRYYYMARNNLCFIREYKKYLPVLKEYAKLMYILVNGCLAAEEKRKTLRYILLGINDANHNRMGKCAN